MIDFTKSNLHVVGYSVPVRTRMRLAPLREHLHTLPEQPDLVPYRTSYYKEAWGFCLSQNTLDSLPDTEYEVVIDSTLADGSLTYAEHVVAGQVSDEVLCRATCHPRSNDNLWPPSRSALNSPTAGGGSRTTLRFVRSGNHRRDHVPARNAERVDKIKHGLVLACAGDSGSLTTSEAGAGTRRSTRSRSMSWSRPAAPTRSSTSPLWLRRAAVLLAGVQHRRRMPDQDPVRGIPGVPHIR